MRDYVILTDATADHIEDILNEYPFLDIIPMKVLIGNREYLYGGRDSEITCSEFYDLQRNGCFASTALIPPATYMDYFEKYLARGLDIIYLCFSSGMSGCFQTAVMTAGSLNSKYPDCRIRCIDTLNGSTPEGFLVREAAERKRQGMTFDELAEWAEASRLKIGVCFSVDTLEHLVHGGRLSKTSGFIGQSFQIKPLLKINDEGKLEVTGVSHGMNKAMRALLKHMQEGWAPDLGRYVLICHGDHEKRAVQLKTMVQEAFPDAEVEIGFVDPVIGAHTGPGMISLVYWSTRR